MAITADVVKTLRERTGAGMMECKKALVETGGDLDAAAEIMRKAGLAKADKKAARIAAEGAVVVARSVDGRSAILKNLCLWCQRPAIHVLTYVSLPSDLQGGLLSRSRAPHPYPDS